MNGSTKSLEQRVAIVKPFRGHAGARRSAPIGSLSTLLRRNFFALLLDFPALLLLGHCRI
jgi:hypothetical protein